MTVSGRPASKRDAFAQGRLEGDFAAHRAFGDRRDMRADADARREFVDTFLADQGRIHIGEEQLLAPARRRLRDGVDLFAGQRGAKLRRARAQSAASSPAKNRSAATPASSHCVEAKSGSACAARAIKASLSAGSQRDWRRAWRREAETAWVHWARVGRGRDEAAAPFSSQDRRRAASRPSRWRLRKNWARRSSTPIRCRSIAICAC